MPAIEQGPIRPPSEAHSLLLRVTRNCSWNRCEFCHIYKGRKFSPRTVEEVKKDIDTVKKIVTEIKSASWNLGYGGEVNNSLAGAILNRPQSYREGYRNVLQWLFAGAKNVFLQDANNLILRTKNLVEILNYLKDSFPSVNRITTYSRARTVARKKVDELRELHEAGLSRVHMGLESGYDPILEFVQKGVTAREHIDAGRKIKQSGISLSEYIMPGLGGKSMWREHAVETARVLNEIDPDFIRVRTLKVLDIMPLHRRIEGGEFELLSDDGMVEEEKLLIENLDGITSRIVSDHMLNLLEEVQGKLPEDKEAMIVSIDRFLALSDDEKDLFQLGRRLGVFRTPDDLERSPHGGRIRALMDDVREKYGGLETGIREIMKQFI